MKYKEPNGDLTLKWSVCEFSYSIINLMLRYEENKKIANWLKNILYYIL